MIKILLGGSPCTYWSIAQKNNRETQPSGIGWELFENYLIAKEKFKPDYFLYENNKSAAQAIKDEIKNRLNVWDGSFLTEDSGARYIEINSALVSAQNRQRFYVHNCGDVEQPKDRGILLRDILESGVDLSQNEKSYCLTSTYDGAVAWNTIERKQRTMVAEPVRIPEYSSDKARPLNASYKNKGSGEGSLASECFPDNPNKQVFDYIAEPVNVTPNGKAQTIKAQYQNTSLVNICCYKSTYGATGVAEPVCVQEQVFGRQANDNGEYDRRYEARLDGKSGSLTGTNRQNAVAEPVRIGDMGSKAQAHRIYSIDGKSVCINSGGGGLGAKTGLYAVPVYYGAEAIEFDESGKPTKARSYADGKIYTAYEVRNGLIKIKDKQYPIKLKDGFYIIRKLTVTECCRLQTLPDDFCRARIEKVKEIVLKCKDVPTQIVTIPLQTEKQGCAINTTFDLKEMEVQNLKDPKLIPHCLALSKDVIDIDKHTWDTVLCIIRDLQEQEPQDWLEAIMNMCVVTTSTDLNIEKLPKECWGENLKKEKSSTILTLIKKIIAKITSMFVPQKNTRVYIENCAESCLSTSPTSLTLGISYSTEKNMRLVSESACYKGLGNGWTAEVIIHILSHALKNVPKDEKIVVLSMYDGIGTGRYCLDKMGFTNVEYYACEIDKYAMQIAMSNYPDIIQIGDAFQVRDEKWCLEK